AAILMKTPPAPSSLRAEIPPRLDDIIAQCLEKDPDLRFQSASELRVSLKRLAGASSSSGPASSSGSSAGPVSHPGAAPTSSASHASAVGVTPTGGLSAQRRWIGIAAVVVLAAAGWWWWQARANRSAAAPNLSFRQLTYSGQVQDAAISPDGKFLAHVEAGPQGSSLHLLSVATGGAGGSAGSSDVQIMPPAPGCCTSPTFSPDGSTVYFVEDRTLKMIPVLGGAVHTVADLVCSGAGISPDGLHIAYLAANPGADQLMLANADGTQDRVLHDPRPDGYDSRCWLGGPLYPDAPAWSPDGTTIAVQSSGAGANTFDHVILISARDGAARTLGPDLGQSSSDIAWLPDGSGLLLALAKPWTTPSQVWEITNPGGKLIQLSHDLQGFDR